MTSGDDEAWLSYAPDGRKLRLDPRRALVIGSRALEGLSFPDDARMNRRHCSFERGDGAWRIVDHQSTNGTRLNGLRVEGHAMLVDGDVVTASTGTLTFHAARRGPSGAWRAADFALFGPFCTRPGLWFALDGRGLHTAIHEGAQCATLAGPLARLGRAGEHDVVDDDIAGASIRDVRTETAAHGATFDPALAVAVARTLLAAEVGDPDREIFVTFAGDLVAVGDRAAISNADRLRFAARACLVMQGAPMPTTDPQRAAVLQRDEVVRAGDALFVGEAREPMRALANAAALDPRGVPAALTAAAHILGEPTRSQLRSLVRELFPHAAARHDRLREDVLVHGVDALIR